MRKGRQVNSSKIRFHCQAKKQNYKSNLLTEKYSLLPSQSYQLTPAQTALQQLSEKHPDFEIQPINTIQPP